MSRENAAESEGEGRSVAAFFALVCALSVPFWLLGRRKLPLPVNLPASALTAFAPAAAAGLLTYRRGERHGIRTLFGRAVDVRKIRGRWWFASLLLAPLLYLSTYAIMQAARRPLPETAVVSFPEIPLFTLLYIIPAAGEELGWMGYAADPLQKRWGAARASIVLGAAWTAWHAISFVQTGNPPAWVLWQSLRTFATRVILVWLYNGTGKSVSAAILYHTADNVSWSVFPNYGSHYDPSVANMTSWLAIGFILAAGGFKRSVDHAAR
jgi:membrane protease YdiL (CAAX protease family)